MKILSCVVFMWFVFVSSSVLAADVVKKISENVEPGNSSNNSMTILSNSKIVKDFLNKHNANKKNKKNKPVIPFRSAHNNVDKVKIEKPTVIMLEVPESQPPVVNKAAHFVFRDITQRGDINAGSSGDFSERVKNIEFLRQSAVKR